MGGGELTATRLQELYAKVLARRGKQIDATRCVSPEDLLGLVRREGPEDRRLEVLDHVMACPECRKELELLQAIEAAGAAMAEPSPARSWSRRWLPLALAASVVLALGISLAVRQRVPDDINRGGAASIQLVAPDAEVAAAQPIAFTWHPLSGAGRYRLELLDSSDAVVFSTETSDTTLLLPAGRLRAGGTYRWWVRDATPGAQRSSALRRLRVRQE
jgi:uncharacterized protein YbaR (Trm112 family)